MGDSEKMTTKSFGGFEIKDAEKGEVEAIIATLEVVDRDGDILRKGSIPDGVAVQMSAWGHDAVFGSRPVGKGTIHIDGNKALFKGRVFLNTAEGRETFEVLKEMGRDQEWSWGFQVVGSEVPSENEKKQGAWRILTKTSPFEVSPVIIGAGIGTRTLGVKGADAQADGAADEKDEELVAEVLAAVAARRLEAKQKRDEDAARMEAERIAAETKAAEDAEVARMAPLIALRDRYLRTVDEHTPSAQREFERFQRTMQRHKSA
jgi:hypothetical protein